MEGFILKKKLVGLLLTAAMLVTALAGCGNGDSSSSDNGDGADSGAGDTAAESDADAGAGADYDVENREYKDVNITIHTRWDVGDVSGPLYQAIVEGFMEKYPGITVEQINIPTESEWLNSESVLMSDPSSMPNVLVEYGGSRTARNLRTTRS